MDKKVINKEQFKKMVIEEAKKYISEDNSSEETSTKKSRTVTIDAVESLISEMESMNKSISSLIEEGDIAKESAPVKSEDPAFMWKPNQGRDLDPIEHNSKKNIMHVNEGEKDKWKRMLKYEVPSDDER